MCSTRQNDVSACSSPNARALFKVLRFVKHAGMGKPAEAMICPVIESRDTVEKEMPGSLISRLTLALAPILLAVARYVHSQGALDFSFTILELVQA